MRKLTDVTIKSKGKFSETNKISHSFKMLLLEVVQSKRGKTVFFDNFRYAINKKTQISNHLERFRKHGVRMVANASLTKITEYPGQHIDEEEIEEIKKEKHASKIDFSTKERPDESFERRLRKCSWIQSSRSLSRIFFGDTNFTSQKK